MMIFDSGSPPTSSGAVGQPDPWRDVTLILSSLGILLLVLHYLISAAWKRQQKSDRVPYAARPRVVSPSRLPMLYVVLLPVLAFCVLALAYRIYITWDSIEISSERISFVVLCFMFMMLGIFTQILYGCYRDHREMRSIELKEILLPFCCSGIIFFGVWTKLGASHNLINAFYTSFLSGFTIKTLIDPTE